MPYSIVISDLALVNSARAIQWYEEKKPGLGLAFESALTQCYATILQNPVAFSYQFDFVRKASVKNYPYVVLFEIYDDAVFITNVFNTHQNPYKRS